MLDTDEDVYGEVMVESVGLKRQSQDISGVTKYGKHLLALGNAHGLVIYSGFSQWPGLDALTCWHLNRGASTIDYLMGSPSLILEVTKFTISCRPIGLVANHTFVESYKIVKGDASKAK